MKRLILVFLLMFVMGLPLLATAEDESKPITITAKQGFIMTWNDPTVKNLTTFEILKTKPVENWGKWNAILDGWSLDAGFAWDTKTINNGAIILGRKFGTLGKYIKFLDFPLLNKIDVTIYPVGLYIENLTDHPTLKGCSGGAIIKAEIKFG